MIRRNVIAASVATSMVLVAGTAAAISLVALGSGQSDISTASAVATTPTVTVVEVEFVDEVVTTPPPGVVIPPDWPVGAAYPPLPTDCRNARLELTGVWTCDT